jgi:hypothetical protein
MATDYKTVDAEFMAEFQKVFSPAEAAELLMMVGQYISLGRMLYVTGGHRAACEIYVPEY